MFDISKLVSGVETVLEFDETYSYYEEMIKTTPIKQANNINGVGKITRINDNVYHLEMQITGNIILECARSLESVEYPINIFIDKNIDNEDENLEEKQYILQNSLDIFGIIWENIVLEVPLRVVKEDANFISEGNGWSLISENEKVVDSPFSELQSMLDMEGKR